MPHAGSADLGSGSLNKLTLLFLISGYVSQISLNGEKNHTRSETHINVQSDHWPRPRRRR